MKIQDKIMKDILIAEKRILELNKSEELKSLSEIDKYKIAIFFKEKSKNRLETARLVYNVSKNIENKKINNTLMDYNDYSEVVAASYYAMYYSFHAFLAQERGIKLKEGLRGVHEKTMHLIFYYLVKTKKLANHLYEEYIKTLGMIVEVQKINVEDFQEKAYKYAKDYETTRSHRETFTYNVTTSVEENTAKQAIKTAEEFINIINQLMIKK